MNVLRRSTSPQRAAQPIPDNPNFAWPDQLQTGDRIHNPDGKRPWVLEVEAVSTSDKPGMVTILTKNGPYVVPANAPVARHTPHHTEVVRQRQRLDFVDQDLRTILPVALHVEVGPRHRYGQYRDHRRDADYIVHGMRVTYSGTVELLVQWADGEVGVLSTAWKPHDDAVVVQHGGANGLGRWKLTPRETLTALVKERQRRVWFVVLGAAVLFFLITGKPAHILSDPMAQLIILAYIAATCVRFGNAIRFTHDIRRLARDPDAPLTNKQGERLATIVANFAAPINNAIARGRSACDRRYFLEGLARSDEARHNEQEGSDR